MRLTSLLPDGEPNCLVLKVRQMLIMLDCGLGQEQLHAMPVREGGLAEDQKDATSTAAGSTADSATTGSKRKLAEPDIRQDWASFLKASSTQFPSKKVARGSNGQPTHTSSTAGSSSAAGANSSGSGAQPSTADGTASSNTPSSRSTATREYMFKLPDFSGVDLKAIDVVLISNYNHILALPYLTEYTDFQGRIFATEPTLEFGRQLMTEFVTFFGTSVTSSPHEIIDRKELVARAGAGLYPAYTHADIKACIDKIQPVRFREHISLFGSLKLTAHSAGYCLGSSNWLIQIGTENIAYVSTSSTQGNLHPDLFDGTLLENASTVVATDLCPHGSITYDSGVNEVCASIAHTISKKGHVLVPCTISGFLFDLLEDIHLHLNRMGLSEQVQYSFVSPVADTALQYANILAEWMAPRKQEMVYLPEAPLLHGILLEKGPAKHYKSVHGAFSSDLKLPCIVFGGHPSLRSGPMVNLLHMWGHKSNNSIVFIEPRMDVTASMEPFENLEITRRVCPLDIRLSIDQLVDVMNKYKHPRHVLVPLRATASTLADGTAELADAKRTTSTSSTRWSPYKVGESVQLGMGSLYESVLLSEELARGILPQAFGNVSFAPIAGSLSIFNNQMQLKPATVAGRQLLALYTQRLLLGVMNLPNLLAGLAQIGVVDPEVSESEGGEGGESGGVPEIKVEFELQGQPASIILREKETIVKCDENVRPLLREPILKCFQTL
ncbi:Integrator complex subunit 9 [Mortierella sp. GBA35]|nr:Integrator complex subunit 9 [Mortierella sp. AD031]KAF9104808.1 Integrator complex subunit 9 [Mortierella sp. GBA35]KAG0199575.1 Integrator complex subunit 9 [Mortierella sp. NVP41]